MKIKLKQKGWDNINSKEKAIFCSQIAEDKKATNPIILDLHKISSVTDYFLICSATSDRHVKAIADAIDETLKKKGIKLYGIEGYSEGKWILMDYVDLVIHIFYEQVREFYNLERLWRDVPQIETAEKKIKANKGREVSEDE